MQANKIKFRASGNGYIMTDPQGKSNLEKWTDGCIRVNDLRAEYDKIQNKDTKTAAKKLESLKKAEALVMQLTPIKDQQELSETCKTHLVDLFISHHYGRKEEINSKFLTKGNVREEDSITLLSRVHKKFYKKNAERLSNEYIQGEVDLYEGEALLNAEHTIDTKTSWSLHTFLRAKFKPLDAGYYWQGQSYMALTGAKKHTVAYCLVNSIDTAINDEKRKLSFMKGMIDRDGASTPEFIEKCKQIEINHIFDLEAFRKENPHFEFDNDLSQWNYDIPMEDRIHTFTFERNEDDIKRLYDRITNCRTWMEEHLFKKELIEA